MNSFGLILAISSYVLGQLQPIYAYANCTIRWSDSLPSWYPIVYNSSGIIYPRRVNGSDQWNIIVKRYANFNLGCADSSNQVKGYTENEIVVKCATTGLTVNRAAVDFGNLGCSKQVREKVVTTGICYNESTMVDIQFPSNSSQLPLVNICHDKNIDATTYSHHYIIGPGINPYEVSNSRPSFKEAQFYTTISANDAYTQSSQLNQVALLVDSQTLAEKYINTSKSFYFARGHLAPDGDFVHVYEQNATYYYINVVPQWQSINNGNWKALETAVRNYAKTRYIDLEVWTGGQGVLKLDDVNGNPVDIYLARDSKGTFRVPAPELSWKVVQDSTRNASVAVFMVNNPHLNEIPSRLIVCPDVCSQISWVTWDTKNIQKGYTFCCEAAAYKKVLPYLSEIRSMQLMT